MCVQHNPRKTLFHLFSSCAKFNDTGRCPKLIAGDVTAWPEHRLSARSSLLSSSSFSSCSYSAKALPIQSPKSEFSASQSPRHSQSPGAEWCCEIWELGFGTAAGMATRGSRAKGNFNPQVPARALGLILGFWGFIFGATSSPGCCLCDKSLEMAEKLQYSK